jgi:diadenosine tetraphosphate (Ap4A) HIT family hydrolase
VETWREIDPRWRRSGLCFVCELVAGNPDYRHHVFYEDASTVAFVNRFPVLRGHVLVAPREHREQVTGDFDEDEYAALQRVVHRVGEAVRAVTPTERLYVLSLGSREANRHVHWHVAPLPPGVPFEQQQLRALDRDGRYLELPDAELEALAGALRAALDRAGTGSSSR